MMAAPVRLGLVGAVLAVSAFTGCEADSSSEPSAASTPEPTGIEDSPTPSMPVPAATPEDRRCSDPSPMVVDDDATVTFGPINGVTATTTGGEPLVVVGTVYAHDCTPLAGATLTMYQTDADGEYGPGHGTDDMLCCYLGGSVQTDAQGHFQVNTVRPAHYRGEANPPPAHIHLEVSHPDAPRLNSEIVFADDELLPANAQSQGLIVTTPTGGADGWSAVAEIVMSQSGAPA
jgi:protocatechuate 3,4-dioxygenase beta subunit